MASLALAERLRARVLAWLRVPPEPEPPAGASSSIRVFRAAPAYFRYRRAGWAVGQLGTLLGLVVGLALGWSFIGDWRGARVLGAALGMLGALAWLAFLVQIPLSYAALRLDYELRWYMLSDRALRIREGILRVREKTMTFANIQQIAVRQGPLQRAFGIADVEVRTAGGGSSSGEPGEDMHRAYFRGVADPEGIRDTIRARVERYRESAPGMARSATGGEGSALAHAEATGAAEPGTRAPTEAAILAAREVLAEARSLRSLPTRGSGPRSPP